MTIHTDNTTSSPSKSIITWQLGYEIALFSIIVLSLLMLGADYLLSSNLILSLAQTIPTLAFLAIYQNTWHPWIHTIDQWVTLFLISELSLRWIIAIYYKHYHRWFFFPFARWYDVIGCIPTFRLLRLLRAGVIAYKLHQAGYAIIPKNMLKTIRFYYQLLLEELSDRIVLQILSGAEKEINRMHFSADSTTNTLLDDILTTHRVQLTEALEQLLSQNIPLILQRHSSDIEQRIGGAVSTAVNNTQSLNQFLQQIPLMGKHIETLIHTIAHELGANISHEIMKTLISPNQYGLMPHQDIAREISEANYNSPALNALLQALASDVIKLLRQQVAIQQWKTTQKP